MEMMCSALGKEAAASQRCATSGEQGWSETLIQKEGTALVTCKARQGHKHWGALEGRSSPGQGGGTISCIRWSIPSCQAGNTHRCRGCLDHSTQPHDTVQLPCSDQEGVLKMLWRDSIIVHYVTATNVSDLRRC